MLPKEQILAAFLPPTLQTLTERNTRASSPMMSREIDRYFKTERRASYLGDISSGGHRDFRYYNYRHVPYYGGSDYYS